MIISDEQARLAAQDLRGATHATTLVRPTVEHEFLDRVRAAVQDAPDTREDRVAEATCRLGAGCPDSHEIASKMISRIVSDALR